MTEDPRVYMDEVRRIAAELVSAGRESGCGALDGQPRRVPHRRAERHRLRDAERDARIRRWYPVIDYSRCTNCMECIDFCLFGVYGIDQQETILVEQPDNCRKGCPACSRVCPGECDHLSAAQDARHRRRSQHRRRNEDRPVAVVWQAERPGHWPRGNATNNCGWPAANRSEPPPTRADAARRPPLPRATNWMT